MEPRHEDKKAVPTGEIQLVLFRMAGSEFGIEIKQVREINRVTAITRVPKSPDFLEGIMNLRGRIVPVVDLKKRFRLAPTETTSQTRIMIAEVGDQPVGLWVDKVVEVLKVPATAISPPPDMILTIAGEYLTGIVEVHDRLVTPSSNDLSVNGRDHVDESVRPVWEDVGERESAVGEVIGVR